MTSNGKSMKVDFMIIGAQKCGTTSVATQLAQHPDVCFSRVKEPGYFNRVQEWQSEIDSYHKLFSAKDDQICGEASTMYTFSPEWEGTHARLNSYNPDLKLIYMMRNPIERVISNYSHNLVRGIVKESPEKIVLSDPAYINRSKYWMQIEPYLGLFTENRIRLIVFEEYISNQQLTLDQIAPFLGISSNGFDRSDDAREHKTIGNWYLKYEWMREFTNTESFQIIRQLFPENLRKALRKRLSRRLEQKPQFSVDLQRSIWSVVEDDVRRIEDFLGREIRQWRNEHVK